MYNKLEEYNGYTNKPTYLFNKYFEPSQNEYFIKGTIELIENSDQDAIDNFLQQDPVVELSDIMKQYYEDRLYERIGGNSPNVWDELMQFAFTFINWDEIAEGVIESAYSYYKTSNIN